MTTAIRDYDVAMAAKLLGTVVTPALPALPYYAVTVPGITNPVRLHNALPEDWYGAYALPGIAVLRVGEMPDPTRYQPAFQGQVLLTSPANTYELQVGHPLPLSLLYQVHLAAESVAVMNALLTHVLFRLPMFGYGANLAMYGTTIAFRYTGHKDLTDYEAKEGRVFRRVVSYTVEGWMAETTVTQIGEIMHVVGEIDIEPDVQSLGPPPVVPLIAEDRIAFGADDLD